MKDRSELQRACEVLANEYRPAGVGALRPYVTVNNANGLHAEIFCELDMMKDECWVTESRKHWPTILNLCLVIA